MRSETKVRKQVEIWRDDFEWFVRTHEIEQDNNRTGFPALVAMLLHSYREVCENPGDYKLNSLDPISLTLAAARDAKEKTEESSAG